MQETEGRLFELTNEVERLRMKLENPELWLVTTDEAEESWQLIRQERVPRLSGLFGACGMMVRAFFSPKRWIQALTRH